MSHTEGVTYGDSDVILFHRPIYASYGLWCTNLQLGYYIVPLLCVGCVWQPPINEHDDDDELIFAAIL